MTIFVVAVASVSAVAVVAWFVLGRGHPEGAAGHGPAATEPTSERLYGDAGRPAGSRCRADGSRCTRWRSSPATVTDRMSPQMLWLRIAPSPEEDIADSATSLWETAADAAPRVAVAFAIVLVGWLLAHGLRWLLHRRFQKNQTPSFATVMSKIVSWVFLGVVVLAAITITFPSVKPVDLLAGLGFFSVAVGFAFQDILENTLSGILLLVPPAVPIRRPDHGRGPIRHRGGHHDPGDEDHHVRRRTGRDPQPGRLQERDQRPYAQR